MKQVSRITSFFFVVLLFLQVFSLAAQDQVQPPALQITADALEAVAGQTISVTVSVTGAVEVYGGSFKLAYDPQAFEILQTENKPVVPGAFFAGEPGFALRNAVDPSAGTIEYALTLMQPALPVSGDGVLGTITLRALKDAPVTVAAMNASFVAPEFTEVDGRLVAQRVNQVAASIDSAQNVELATNALAVSNGASVSVASAGQESAPVTDPAVVGMFSSPQLNDPNAGHNTGHQAGSEAAIALESVRQTDNVVSIAAVLFLVFGVVLLTLSVGMYSRMRVHYTLAGDRR